MSTALAFLILLAPFALAGTAAAAWGWSAGA